MATHRQTTFLPTDETLVARIAEGDVAAFSLLYDRYERPVYALACHLLGATEAEDVVQEAFLRLWNSADQFEESRGRFAAWFLSIARHEVFSRLRQRTREQRLALAHDIDRLLAEAPDLTTDVETQTWQREQEDCILQALRGLPAEQRQVLILAYFGDLSQSAIAQALGWPLGTVKKRVRLGLQKLRAALLPRDIASRDNYDGALNGQADPVRRRDQVQVEDEL
jgi:RNA polymerase sigma-70 factor, ECF subfamily